MAKPDVVRDQKASRGQKAVTRRAQEPEKSTGPAGVSGTPPQTRLEALQRAADQSRSVEHLRNWQAAASASPVLTRAAPAPDARQDPSQMHSAGIDTPLQRQGNGDAKEDAPDRLPRELRTGMEHLAGMSLDDVRVHRGSSEPERIGALAYAQGRDIHLGPGEEKHLPHEAWHVVQQAQGRVRSTLQTKGVAINDDPALEREADIMGAKALGSGHRADAAFPVQRMRRQSGQGVVQRNPRLLIHYARDSGNQDQLKWIIIAIIRSKRVSDAHAQWMKLNGAIERDALLAKKREATVDDYAKHLIDTASRKVPAEEKLRYSEAEDERDSVDEPLEKISDEEEELGAENGSGIDVSSLDVDEKRGSGFYKKAKDAGSHVTNLVKRLFLGKRADPDSDKQERQSLLASDSEGADLKSGRDPRRKAIVGVVKLVAGNVVSTGVNARKAVRIGQVKKQMSAQHGLTEREAADLRAMANSLKGSFKRQATFHGTVGSLQQGASVGATAFGAPGATQIASAAFGALAGELMGGVSDTTKDTIFSMRNPKHLTEEQWEVCLNEYLNHDDYRVRYLVQELIKSVTLSSERGEALIALAYDRPAIAARLIFARTKGEKEWKDAVKTYQNSRPTRKDL